MAQEGGGQAQIGFQQYYLAAGSERLANISGLTLNYSQFIPDVGLLSAGLAPALSSNQFRTGDDYLRLTGLPWKGQYWNLGIGDFYVPGQLVPSSFTNVYFPQIAGRGVSMEASHGGRTIGFFYGSGTIANTPRVVLRVAVPQTVAGVYIRQKIGSRLVLGARYMHFADNLAALRNSPWLTTQTTSLKSANVLSVDAVYTLAKSFKWYAEAAWSASTQETPGAATRKVPFSTLVGPVFETEHFTLRANYVFQNASYFPLLGYYLGDRAGPYGEVRVRPLSTLEFYGSASEYENNVAHDPTLPTFRNSSESAGATLQLPGGLNLIGQLTTLDLFARENAGSAWQASRNRQITAMVTRPFHQHNLRLTAREFTMQSATGPQRQRSESVEDIFHAKGLMLGGGVKIQRQDASDARTTLYYRGLAQFQRKRFSAYANIETGKDLQNRTLFATNAISTTIFGASVALNQDWDFQGERTATI